MTTFLNEDKLDDLFSQLDQVTKTLNSQLETNTAKEENSEFSKDELKFEDEGSEINENGKSSITKFETFQEIEKNLKNLPKLKNSFDKLCYTDVDKYNTVKQPFMTLDDEIDVNDKKLKNGIKSKYQNSTSSEFTNSYNKELKRNLLVLKNRHALDPKRHYRRLNINMKGDLSNYKVGTILDDMYENGKKGGVLNSKYNNGSQTSSLVSNIDKSNSILKNYISDNDTDKYFKRKYFEIQESKTKYGKNKHHNKRKNK
ncbi:hypothetical protein QEN19_003808 [Hanseniaspora menglaensis]